MAVIYNKGNEDKPILKIYPSLIGMLRDQYKVGLSYPDENIKYHQVYRKALEGEPVIFSSPFMIRAINKTISFNIFRKEDHLKNFTVPIKDLMDNKNGVMTFPLERGTFQIIIEEMDVSGSSNAVSYMFEIKVKHIKKFALFTKNLVYLEIQKPIAPDLYVPVCHTETVRCGDLALFGNTLDITCYDLNLKYRFALQLAGKKPRLIGAFDALLESFNPENSITIKDGKKRLAEICIKTHQAKVHFPPSHSFLRHFENGLNLHFVFNIDCRGFNYQFTQLDRSITTAAQIYYPYVQDSTIDFYSSEISNESDKPNQQNSFKANSLEEIIESYHSFEPCQDTLNSQFNLHLLHEEQFLDYKYVVCIFITDSPPEKLLPLIKSRGNDNFTARSFIFVSNGKYDYSPIKDFLQTYNKEPRRRSISFVYMPDLDEDGKIDDLKKELLYKLGTEINDYFCFTSYDSDKDKTY